MNNKEIAGLLMSALKCIKCCPYKRPIENQMMAMKYITEAAHEINDLYTGEYAYSAREHMEYCINRSMVDIAVHLGIHDLYKETYPPVHGETLAIFNYKSCSGYLLAKIINPLTYQSGNNMEHFNKTYKDIMARVNKNGKSCLSNLYVTGILIELLICTVNHFSRVNLGYMFAAHSSSTSDLMTKVTSIEQFLLKYINGNNV